MGKGTESRRRGGGKPPKPTSVLNAVWQRKKLGKYNLLAILGKGAMGGVFRAEDDLLKRQVALKVLPQRIGDQGGNAWGVEQFIREARSAAQIEHPNVTRIYEIGEEHGYYYIAMELVEGGDLESKVKKEGPLDPDLACKLISQCASGLHFAHNMGVVHRDVKPANVMLTKDGQAKLTDFGLARIDDPDDEFSLPTEMVGTPKYVAPEVCLGQAATSLSDVYSLGATMWFVLTGEAPFNEKDPRRVMAMQVKAPLPDLTEIRADLPNSLVSAVYRSLAKKAEDRFKNCEEMAEVLSNHEGQNDELSSLASAIDDAVTGFTPAAKSANTSMTSRSGAKRSGAGGKPIRQPREVTRKKQNNNAIIIGIVVGVVLLLVVGGGLAALFMGGPSTPEDPDPPQQNPKPPIVVNPGDRTGPGDINIPDPSDPKDPDPKDPDQPVNSGTDWANAKPVRSFGANSSQLYSVAGNKRIYQVNGSIDGVTEIGGNYRINVFIRGRGIRVEYAESNSELVTAVNAKLGVTGPGLPQAADGEEVEVLGHVNDVNGLLIITLESADQIKRKGATDRNSVARTPADTDLAYVPVAGRIGTTGVYGKAHFVPDYYFRSDNPKLKEFAQFNQGRGQVAVIGKVVFAGKHASHNGQVIALEGQDPAQQGSLLVHFHDEAKIKKMLERFAVDNLSDLVGRTMQINGRLTYKDGRMIYDRDSNDERKYYWAISEPGQTYFLGSLAKQFFIPSRSTVEHDDLKRMAARGDNVSYGVMGQVTRVQNVNGHYRVYITDSTTDNDFFVSISRDQNLQRSIVSALKRITKDQNATMESMKGLRISATGKLMRQDNTRHVLVVGYLGQLSIAGQNMVFEQLRDSLRGQPISPTDSKKLDQAKTMQVEVNVAVNSQRAAHRSGSRWLVRMDNDVVIAVAEAAADDVLKKLGLSSRNAVYGQFTATGHISTGNRYGKYTIFVDSANQVSRGSGAPPVTNDNNNTPTNNNDNKNIQNAKDWLTVKPDKRYKSTETKINNDADANPDLIFAVYGQLGGGQDYKYTLGNIEMHLTKEVVDELKKRLSTDKLGLNDRNIEVLGNMKTYDQGSRVLTISAVEQIVNIDGVDGFRTGQAKLPEKKGGGDPAAAKPEFDVPNGFEKLDFTVDNLRLDLFRKLTNQTRDDFAAIGEVTAIERMGRNGWVITLKEADPALFRVTIPTSTMTRLIRMKVIEKETDLVGKHIMALGRLDNKMRLDGKAVPRIIVRKDADLKIAE